MIIALIGVFFSTSAHSVHRWYRIPILDIGFQPSEFTKLVVVMTISWFLEKRKNRVMDISTGLLSGIIVGIPFLLILKQPDLGTALVLYPITLVMFYFGGIHPFFIKIMLGCCFVGLVIVLSIFTDIIPYEDMRQYATNFVKEYQYERLNPETFHQKAAMAAISIGGVFGRGWRKCDYTSGGWLPYPYTDSVFPVCGEAFGMVGLLILILLFYSLIYCCFQVTIVAKDDFGRLLSAGITVYLAMHIIINIGMMLGFLPITGVPLILITYGGSSVLSTMIALGILQSIYSRRFMF